MTDPSTQEDVRLVTLLCIRRGISRGFGRTVEGDALDRLTARLKRYESLGSPEYLAALVTAVGEQQQSCVLPAPCPLLKTCGHTDEAVPCSFATTRRAYRRLREEGL